MDAINIPSAIDDMADAELQWHPWVSKINVLLDYGALMPTRAHELDAGYDLYAPANMIKKPIWNGDDITINTGVHVEIPKGFVGFIKSKSGLNVKQNITTTGVIDAGYTGSIVVKLHKSSGDRYKIMPGDKIAQLVILPIVTPELVQVDRFKETDRGNNGFGSSGR